MSSVKTTLRNPIVTIWEDAISKDYDAQGMLGSMHVSTAAGAYDFANEAKPNSIYNTLGDKQYAKSGNGIWIEFNPKSTAYWMAEDEAHPEHIKYDERGELI